jgi:hypothetical protein
VERVSVERPQVEKQLVERVPVERVPVERVPVERASAERVPVETNKVSSLSDSSSDVNDYFDDFIAEPEPVPKITSRRKKEVVEVKNKFSDDLDDLDL